MLGVLHTLSSYTPSKEELPHDTEDVKQQILDMQIKALEAREDAFASKFGYSNLEEFIKNFLL